MTRCAGSCYILVVEITWLGHSCFRLKGRRISVITDPYPPDLGYSMGKQTADIVTVSHPHPSHSFSSAIGGPPKISSGPGEYEIGGVLILGVSSFHDNEGGLNKGKNTIYFMEIDEVSVCHLGDLGHVLTTTQTAELDNADVLLLPVGGVSTINAAIAAEVVRQLEPKIVIPMHYKTPVLKRELEPLENFLKEVGVEQVVPQPKLSVTRTNLPETTKVIVLDYPH